MTDLTSLETAAQSAVGRPRRGLWRSIRRRPLFWVCAAVIAVLTVLSLFPGTVAGWFGSTDPYDCDLLLSGEPPQAGHAFGFDLQGCDIYTDVVYGTRTSLAIGVLTTAMALVLAFVVGVTAGYYGRWVDSVLARITDVFLGFPFLLGAVIVLNSTGDRSVVTVSGVLALFSWPAMARLVRSAVRQVKEADFVQGAIAMGLPPRRILLRYIVPNAIGPVLALATILIGAVIVAESTLTFLGVGLQAPSISWGLQLSSAQGQFQQYPHMLLFPGLFLSVTVISLIALGDLLRDALDPRNR